MLFLVILKHDVITWPTGVWVSNYEHQDSLYDSQLSIYITQWALFCRCFKFKHKLQNKVGFWQRKYPISVKNRRNWTSCGLSCRQTYRQRNRERSDIDLPMIHFHRDPKFLSHRPLLVIGNKRESMLVVGVRGSRRDKDKGKGRRRLEEVRVFLDLGFEREKSGWRIFFFLDFSV